MRKKITLLVAVLFGLLAFGVTCSPALSDQPVADPHGTPEQQWTWWPWHGVTSWWPSWSLAITSRLWPWWRGCGVASVCVWWSCRGVLAVSVVSHVCGGVVAVTWRCAWCDCVALCRGCDTPMNASVSNDFHGVSISRFAQSIGCVYSESHQANDNERNRDGREATTTETTTARMVTRSPLTGAAWMIEN